MSDPLTIIHGDALSSLRTMLNESVQTCVTSPPYWGLRDYGTATWEGGSDDCDHLEPQGGSGMASAKQNTSVGSQVMQYKSECLKCGAVRIDIQIGLEKTPDEYVARLVEVFQEVKRVLRNDGTLWLNLGDSYAGSGNGWQKDSGSSIPRKWLDTDRPGADEGRPPGYISSRQPSGLKPKDLVGIPWMVAFALRADGWYLRSDIIWSKPNPMPESVTDRPTKAHEYIFLLSKSQKYFFDYQAVREPMAAASLSRLRQDVVNQIGTTRANGGAKTNGNFKAAGDVDAGRNIRSVWTVTTQPFHDAHFATFPTELVTPCILAGTPVGGVVFDPFAGSGTTGKVAIELGRQAVLIEPKAEYVEMIKRRCQTTIGLPLASGNELSLDHETELTRSGV